MFRTARPAAWSPAFIRFVRGCQGGFPLNRDITDPASDAAGRKAALQAARATGRIAAGTRSTREALLIRRASALFRAV